MGATTTTLDAILKDYYIGPLQEQLNNEVMVLNMFEKAKISWAGRQGVVPVHVGRNVTGVAYAAERYLPTAGNQDDQALNFTAAYLYGRFEVTGQAIALPPRAARRASSARLSLRWISSRTTSATRLIVP
jgi:hypothetical protein